MFRTVWPVLYGLIAWSGARAWKRRDKPALALWGTQLALNAAWSPLFFGAKKARAAMVDVVLTALATAAYTARMATFDKAGAAAMAPYLGWLGYAATLNGAIVRKNPKFLAG